MTKRATRTLAVLLACLLCAGPALGAPRGEQKVHGDVRYERNEDGSISVIHASDGAIIHYESFDIFAGEVLRFAQPHEQARVLNRVFGDATHIEGSLIANGIVYIVNPAGVFLDGNAVVEVGGLVAAAGNISDEDFLAGVDRFELTGPLASHGESIRGDSLTLLGRTVENSAKLSAPDGTIALVAGDRVVLTRIGGSVLVEVDAPPDAVAADTGVLQTGEVDAGAGQVIFAVGDHYALAINHQGVTRGGAVELRGGQEGVLLVQGEIDASSDATGAASGGEILVQGERIALVDARLDASGDAGGGRIRVGGDVRGGGGLATARRSYVDRDSELLADARTQGDGGSVVVWGDEAAVMSGRISARGGARGGDGGFAEISSLGLLEASGEVALSAPAGDAGTLLFDPRDIEIVGGSADGSDDPNTSDTELEGDTGTFGQILFGDVGNLDEPFQIYESEIEGTDANIVLEARNSIGVVGAFTNEVAGEGQGVVIVRDGNDLTLRTANEADDMLTHGIDLGDVEWRTSGGGDITLATGTEPVLAGEMRPVADISVGDLTTSGGGGDVRLETLLGGISAGDIDVSGASGTDGTDGGNVLVRSGDGSLGIDSVDASGGDGTSDGGAGGLVDLFTGDEDGSGDVTLTVAGDLVSRGGSGTAASGGRGGGIQVVSQASPDDSTIGGGPVTIGGSVDGSGGDGELAGGDAGDVLLVAGVMGDLEVGDVSTLGGQAGPAGSGSGGNGGRLVVGAANGDVTTGALDSSGGAGGMDPDTPGLGGEAGVLNPEAGFGEDASGSLTLMGAVRAVDGAGADDPNPSSAGVRIAAADAVEFVGVAGPQITTTESMALVAASVGANAQIEVDGGDPDAAPDQLLLIQVSDVADVAVTTAGFSLIQLQPLGTQASFDVTQAAQKAGGSGVTIDIDGGASVNTIREIDTTQVDAPGSDTVGVPVEVEYRLIDELSGVDDVQIETLVAAGAVTGASRIRIESEDDIRLADGAIVMQELLDPDAFTADPPEDARTGVAADLVLLADIDREGTGGIFAEGNGTAIDMTGGDPDVVAGRLVMEAGSGIGVDGMPIRTENLARVTAEVTDSGGIHLRNVAGGDLGLVPDGAEPFALRVADGDEDGVIGDIRVLNDTGGVLVFQDVLAVADAGGPEITMGGDVELAVAAGSEILFVDSPGARIEGAGDVDLGGPIRLLFDASVVAGGEVRFDDSIDSVEVPGLIEVPRNLTIEGSSVRFGGDVGEGFVLRNLDVTGTTVLDADRSFNVFDIASFDAVDASADDAAAMTVRAGDEIFLGTVRFRGNLGENGRLSGLDAQGDLVLFDADGDQSVDAGAGGIGLNTDFPSRVPELATIGKVGGGLDLTTTGTLEVGEAQKLTVAGPATFSGDTVILGDTNAQTLDVTANTFQVRPRPAAAYLVPGRGLLPDGGSELIADVITTTVAPTLEPTGSGPRPSFATLSGEVGGAGSGGFEVATLNTPIDPDGLLDDSLGIPIFFDLGLGLSDPGNELERKPPEIEALLPARVGDEPAEGSALPPASEVVMGFLDCVELAAGATEGCAVESGSPLDSARGQEIARRYMQLFGSSVEARASRELLASGAARSERDAVLRDVATLLAQLRLLGLEKPAYESLRNELLDAARGALERDRLLAEVRSQARGIPL